MPPTLISRNPPVCSCVTTNALYIYLYSMYIENASDGRKYVDQGGGKAGGGWRKGGEVMNFSRGVLRIRS